MRNVEEVKPAKITSAEHENTRNSSCTICFIVFNIFYNQKINIKNRTYYLFNDTISIEDFNSNLVKLDKKSHKNLNIYYIGYITIKKLMIMKISIV